MENVKRNLIYHSIYQLLIIGIPLFTTPYLSRVLGAEKTGIYSYAYSIATYFVLFIMLGLNNYGNRTVAMVREDREKLSKAFFSIYWIQAVSGIIVSLIYIFYGLCFSNKAITWILFIYVLSSVLDINWFFFGLEQFKMTVTRNIVIKIITTILIFVLVKNSEDIYVYAVISVIGTLLGHLILWGWVHKFVDTVNVELSDIRCHIKPNIVLFIPVIAVSLYKYMDKIMLGLMSSMNEVGYYEYSERITQVPVALINSLGTVMLPKMSNLSSKGENETADRYIFFSMLSVSLVSSITCFGLMSVSDLFVPIFLGNGYEACIYLCRILLPSCLFLAFANVIRTQYLIPRKEDGIYIQSVLLGAVINLIFNLIFIRPFGAYGAAIGTLSAEIIVCIYQLYRIRKVLNVKKMISCSSPFIFTGIVMYICLGLLDHKQCKITGLFFEICIGAVIYMLVFAFIYFILRHTKIGINLKKYFQIILSELCKKD